MAFKRSLTQSFLDDLKDGILQPLLGRVQQDETLMLALRGSYINIYYRGGAVFKIEDMRESAKAAAGKPAVYRAKFDKNYNIDGRPLPIALPYDLSNLSHGKELASSITELKFIMDRFLREGGKPEREFQQLVARENNRSRISKETDYFIIDIEIAKILPGAQFDMLAARWAKGNGRSNRHLVPAVIEMKYGTTPSMDQPAWQNI